MAPNSADTISMAGVLWLCLEDPTFPVVLRMDLAGWLAGRNQAVLIPFALSF